MDMPRRERTAPPLSVEEEAGPAEPLASHHRLPPAADALADAVTTSTSDKQSIRRKRRIVSTKMTLAVSSVLYALLLVRTGLDYVGVNFDFHIDWAPVSARPTFRDSEAPASSSSAAVLMRQGEEATNASLQRLLEMENFPFFDDGAESNHNFQHRHMSKKNPPSSSSERHFHTASENHDFAAYSCESLNDLTTVHGPLTKELQCAFARTCNDGDGIFAPIVYCHPTLSTQTLMILLSPPLILFLTILFRVLGSTAEEFFSPGLEMFSLKMGLPERFAGVTLLALGNGAPDVASTVNAILDDRKRGYLMALGELTGAAMVASTLIVGCVVYVADGVVCRGAMVRDVVFFILTMAVVYKSFEDGTITVTEIKWFVGLYGGYVVLVLGSDLYHKYVHEPRQARRKERRKARKAAAAAGQQNESVEVVLSEASSLLPPQARGGSGPSTAAAATSSSDTMPFGSPPKASNIERMIEFISNYDSDDSNDGSTAGDEDDEEETTSGGDDVETAANNVTTTSITSVEENIAQKRGYVSSPPDCAAPKPNVKRTIKHRHSSDEGWAPRDSDGIEPLMVFHPHHGGLVNLKHASSFDYHTDRHHHHHEPARSPAGTISIESSQIEYDECQACLDGRPGRPPDGWVDAFQSGGQELLEHWTKLWRDTYGSDEYNAAEKVLITCEMPFTVLRMISIPVPCDGYYCRPLVALSFAISPLWMWYYSYQQFGVDLMAGPTVSVVLITLAPLLCALLILRYAPCGEVPMRLTAAVPITIVGFVSSVAWLDMIADKLVSLLSFFGIMLHIPATIMGLTVLAWGNSSQDLVANMTVARKGLSTMAITASFAGPVFNILVGLGIGLTILTQSNHNPGDPVPVSLNNSLRVGFIFSILNGILVIVAGVVVGKGVVPKRYGYVAMIVYAAYAVCSLTL